MNEKPTHFNHKPPIKKKKKQNKKSPPSQHGTERALHTAGMMYEFVARPIRSALKRRSDTVQPYYYEKQTDIDFSTEHDTTTPDDDNGSTLPVEDNRVNILSICVSVYMLYICVWVVRKEGTKDIVVPNFD